MRRWSHAEQQPRRPRRPLERPAPQARDPRMDPLRRPRHRHRRRRRSDNLADEDMGNGESRTADQAVAGCRLPEGDRRAGARAGPQGQGLDDDHASRRRQRRRDAAQGHAARQGGQVALRQGQRGPALARRQRRARDLQARRARTTSRRTASTRRSPPPPPRSARTPTCASSSSATRARTRRSRSRVRGRLQEGRVPLAPDHADDPDRRLRRARRGRAAAAARADRRDGHDRPARPGLPDRPARRGDLLRRAARRPRGRRRLLHVLPAARDGGTRRRPRPRGGARGGRGHLRPRRADLRRHRHGRDGGHVPRRQRRLHLLRRRHDPRRRGRRARLAHRPPGDALLARPEGLDREGPRALPVRAAPSQPRRVARVGSDPRPRAQAPRDLRGARDDPAARARPAGARHAHGQPRRRRPAAQPADHADLRPHPGQVPGRPAAGLGGRPGR